MSAGKRGHHRQHWTARDHDVVRRAAWRTATQATALVTAAFALCGLLMLGIVVTEQARSTGQQLTSALRTVDDVTDPPDGISLVLRSADGTVRVSGGAPSILPDSADLERVVGDPAAGPVTRDLRDRHGVEFRVRTARLGRSGTVAQAALSLASQQEERSRLLTALGLSGLVALVAAAVGGAATGRRAVSGLVDTTSRQRRFVADAGHELRTPLTVLTTRTQLLRRHLDNASMEIADRSVLSRDTESLLADSVRLGALLDDLLLSAEPAADEAAPVDLHDVAADAVAAMLPLAVDREVRLVVTGDPPGVGPVVVPAGRTALGRCVSALLDNATRHTPAGGTVTVRVGSAGGFGSVAVTDTGPGIPPEVRPRLFDRFSHGGDRGEAGRPARDPAGSPRRYGLGLAVVADITHRLGGSVEVDTSASGTTFVLHIPRRR